MAEILKYLAKLPTPLTAVTLIVGDEGAGTLELANLLLQQITDYHLRVHTATRLPLPEDGAASRPNFDFVIFLLDITRMESFKQTEEALQYVDVAYFHGRSCLIVNGAKKPDRWANDYSIVEELANAYNLQIICCQLEDEEDGAVVRRRLTAPAI
ncbi:PREDICTED: centromere protein M-like [Priapulus caudatus]|uniref:Centromere protein M n=1 Tax=Priapulus caudatus TaxID=37621 RepID=A0ABM1EXD4_PRICU|nr:PREDICTED: centromere protein M-like [Priapulus caudatus]